MTEKIIYENHYWCGICDKKATSGTVICVKCWDSCVVSCLRQCLVPESHLKTMKNDFCFTFTAAFVLMIFKFLFWLVGPAEKRIDWKNKVNFKIYDVAACKINNCNANVSQFLKRYSWSKVLVKNLHWLSKQCNLRTSSTSKPLCHEAIIFWLMIWQRKKEIFK